MDYTQLSNEFLENIYKYYQVRSQQKLNEAMHGELFVLNFVAKHNNTTIPSDIKKEMCISSARIAAVLNGLEDKGLITRQIDSADRRRTIIKLTPAGKEKADESIKEILNMTKGVLEYLGEDDAKNFVRIIGRIVEKNSRIEK